MSSEHPAATPRTITIAGAKGGVGKTTTCINLAAQLATEGYETAVLDLDLAMANLLDFLDLGIDATESPTAHEVLAGEAGLGEAVYEAPGGMDVVPSGPTLEGCARADLDRLSEVIRRLKRHYDFVVIDTGAGVSPQNAQPLGTADEVVVVSTPRVASIRDARKTIALVDRVGGTVRGLLLTKSGTGYSPGPERIGEFLGVPVLAHVPEDVAIPRSQDKGIPVVASDRDSEASAAYREFADALLDPPEAPAVTGQSGADLADEDLRSLLWSPAPAKDDREASERRAADQHDEPSAGEEWDEGGLDAEPPAEPAAKTAVSDGGDREAAPPAGPKSLLDRVWRLLD